MAKKPKKKHPRSAGRGNPARNAAVPLNVYRAQRATAAMLPAFADWYAQGAGPSEEAALYLAVAADVAASYLELAGTAEVTAFEPEVLSRLVDTLEAADPVSMRAAMSAFHLYVDFLMETDAWTGSEVDLEVCHELLLDVEEEGDDVEQPVLAVPDIPEAEEAAYLATLPLIHQARALVEWIGAGKQLTASGSLRRKDIEGAAACVGVAARGSQAEPTGEADALVRGGVGLEVSHVRSVSSSDRIPRLVAVLDALKGAALVESTGTKIVPGRPVELDATDPAGLAVWRAFIGVYLWDTFFDSFSAQAWETLSLVQAPVLAAAASNKPVPVADVRSMLVKAIAADADDLDASGASGLAGMAFRDFESLAEVGLIELDSHVRVPRPVARSIMEALQDGFDFALDYPQGTGRGDDAEPARQGARARTSGGEAPQEIAPVYQLKIQLKRSKPPIWRRLEVAADLRLDQLHDAIQAAFDWDGSHLHVFTVGAWPGQNYGPIDEGLAGDGGIDETTVRLADVLTAVGGKFDYVYDFGDDWEHVITLEKILPAPSTGADQPPRCTGGRCMAPLEDSGGTWGWERMVEAANDPTHPEHREFREWLDLADGEMVDPKAFNQDDVNGLLRAVAAHW